MKARYLKKLLNDTSYIVHEWPDKICVGSNYVKDLISVDKETLEVTYALDTFNKGREALDSEKLEFIWDKLHELIESGEIHEIIEGVDHLHDLLNVYTVKDGELIETYTDEYGYPNVTAEGILMYENTFFETKIEAIQFGIDEAKARIRNLQEIITDRRAEIKDLYEKMYDAHERHRRFLNKKSNC